MNHFKKLALKIVKSAFLLTLMQSALWSSHSIADERQSLEQLKATTTNLVDLLVQEGVLSKTKADAMMKKAADDGAVKAQMSQSAKDTDKEESVNDNTVRVQYVPESVKKKLRDEIKQEVLAQAKEERWARPNAIPDWASRLSLYGDIRLRYENDRFSDGNASPAILNNTNRFANIKNSTEDRDRARVRARFGIDANITDWLKGGLRLTTGELNSPVSPNQTQNAKDGKYTVGLDRAFIKAQPFPWLMLQGGRFENPWLSTDLLWDPDLAFDGVAASFNTKLTSGITGFATIGAFPLEDIESSNTNAAKSKWMYGVQTGLKWEALNQTNVKVGLAYYDFKNVEGKSNPLGDSTLYNGTAPAFRQRGNNTFEIDHNNGSCADPTAASCLHGLASKFQILNLTGQVDIANFNPVHVILSGDYVRNLGFNENNIFVRTGTKFKKENEGYQVRLDVGKPVFNSSATSIVQKNDWSVTMGYKYIEADAVLDGFNDSDFHLGGTDTKGWLLGANYGIDKNVWLSMRYFSADAISGPTFSNDVLLLDLNAKF